MKDFEIFLACLCCGKERVLGIVQAEDESDAKDQAFLLNPDASEDEMHVRVKQEVRSVSLVEEVA